MKKSIFHLDHGSGVVEIKKVKIYTDGACSGNPGPGGFAAILTYNGKEKEICGGEKDTTNNRMELMAVITALEALKEECEVEVFSDSRYIVDAINKGWLYNWQKKGWVKSDKSQVLNVDLWKRLLNLLCKHKVSFIWVEGHNGHDYNERCDKLAVEQSRLFSGS